jgi:putative FmdB family regulatory protein
MVFRRLGAAMPIYEYRCSACGYQKDYLQRMSDAPLTDCPECGKRTFNKMVTAAGFHLKGSGWYATDFKTGSKPKPEQDKPAESSKKEEPKKEEPKKAEAAGGAGASPASS